MRVSLFALSAGVWLASSAALALDDPGHPVFSLPRCLCALDRAPLVALRERVQDAASLEEARALASSYTEQARGALRRVRWLAFFDRDSLDAAADRLERYRASVERAPTREAVAAELDALLFAGAGAAALPGNVAPNFAIETACTYSTGEIIAIILGLILGILPGIILIILLC